MGPSSAVSQYHQQNRFFMNDDTPNFNDRDFLNLGYLLVCSGYQILVSKEKVDSEQEEFFAHELHDLVPDSNNADIEIYPIQKSSRFLVKEKLGREHYERFCSGPLCLVLHAVKFDPSSVQNHVNDLLPMMTAQAKTGKGIAFVKVDNGPD